MNFALTNLLFNCVSRPDFLAYDFKDAKRSPGLLLLRRIFQPFCVCYTPKGEEEIAEAAHDFDTIIFEEEKP